MGIREGIERCAACDGEGIKPGPRVCRSCQGTGLRPLERATAPETALIDEDDDGDGFAGFGLGSF